MLKSFFTMCSGVDEDLLGQCPPSEQIKYAGIGATVFFTAVMAFLAGSYALFTVFDDIWIAVAFGFIWGLLIFNLDRFIVSTIRKNEKPYKELLQATPRIVLAILIAVVISKPLELKIFEKEIDRVLLSQKNEMTLENQGEIANIYSPEIERLQSENQLLRQEISDKSTEVNALYQTYISEAEGTAGTMKLGKGPVYKEKREKHDQEQLALDQLRTQNMATISSNEERIAALREEMGLTVANSQPVIDRFDGFMARLKALNELPVIPQIFIFLLFCAIETAPVFAKLISPKGEYDLKFENAEDKIKTWVLQQKRQRKALLATDTALNGKVYESLKDEEDIYLYRKQKAREAINFQTDAFFKGNKELV